jgi:hypothetical protein
MSNSAETDGIWEELRLIIIAYAALTLIYAVFLNAVYGQKLEQELPTLLHSLVEMASGKRINLVIAAIYVLLTTLPLALSALFLFMYLSEADNLHPYAISLCLSVPFIIYFWFIDRAAFYDVWNHSKGEGCGLPNNSLFSPPCSVNWSMWWRLPWEIVKFYFVKYKFPLAVGSVILGSWAGYRLKKIS